MDQLKALEEDSSLSFGLHRNCLPSHLLESAARRQPYDVNPERPDPRLGFEKLPPGESHEVRRLEAPSSAHRSEDLSR